MHITFLVIYNFFKIGEIVADKISTFDATRDISR